MDEKSFASVSSEKEDSCLTEEGGRQVHEGGFHAVVGEEAQQVCGGHGQGGGVEQWVDEEGFGLHQDAVDD